MSSFLQAVPAMQSRLPSRSPIRHGSVSNAAVSKPSQHTVVYQRIRQPDYRIVCTHLHHPFDDPLEPASSGSRWTTTGRLNNISHYKNSLVASEVLVICTPSLPTCRYTCRIAGRESETGPQMQASLAFACRRCFTLCSSSIIYHCNYRVPFPTRTSSSLVPLNGGLRVARGSAPPEALLFLLCTATE